jgi:hypothetical protein
MNAGEPQRKENPIVSILAIIMFIVYAIYIYISPPIILILYLILNIISIFNFLWFYLQKIAQMFNMLKPNYKFLINENMNFKLLDYGKNFKSLNYGTIYNSIVESSLKDSKVEGIDEQCNDKKEPLLMQIYTNDYILSGLLYIMISILCAFFILFIIFIVSTALPTRGYDTRWELLNTRFLDIVRSYNNNILGSNVNKISTIYAIIVIIYVACIIILFTNLSIRFLYFDKFVKDATEFIRGIKSIERNIKDTSIYGGNTPKTEVIQIFKNALKEKSNESNFSKDDIIYIAKKYIDVNIGSESNYDNIRIFLNISAIVYFLMDKNNIDIKTIIEYIDNDLLGKNTKKCSIMNLASMLREDTIIDNFLKEDYIKNASIDKYQKILENIIQLHDFDIYNANRELIKLPNFDLLNNRYENFLILSFILNIIIVCIFIYVLYKIYIRYM